MRPHPEALPLPTGALTRVAEDLAAAYNPPIAEDLAAIRAGVEATIRDLAHARWMLAYAAVYFGLLEMYWLAFWMTRRVGQ